MPKKILFLSPYPENRAPSQRLKYEQYYDIFKKEGYQLTTSSFVDDNFWKIIYKKGHLLLKVLYTLKGYLRRLRDLYQVSRFDIVYVHLWVTPLGPPLFEWLLKLRNSNIIYDIDDLIYLKNNSENNSLISLLKGRKKPIYLMKISRHVIVCTPLLEKFAFRYNHAVTDISSTINTSTYTPKNDYNIKNELVIGWSGSHSTSKYLYLLKNVLRELTNEINFRLYVIGDKDFNIDGINVEAVEWNANSEVEDLRKIDIGLYPLPDEEWVYGKSGLKALQYMALGIPTIATAIGANFRVIEDGYSGFLIPPGDDQIWKEIIIKLYCNFELRKRIGQKARDRVVRLYSIDSNKEKYLSAFRAVISKVDNAQRTKKEW